MAGSAAALLGPAPLRGFPARPRPGLRPPGAPKRSPPRRALRTATRAVTGPEACPSLSPPPPAGAGPGVAQTCPRLQVLRRRSAALPAPAPSSGSAPSFGRGLARAGRGGQGSRWPGVRPTAGTPGPPGNTLFTPFGARTRERGMDRLGGRSPGKRWVSVCQPGRRRWRPPPCSLSFFLHPDSTLNPFQSPL